MLRVKFGDGWCFMHLFRSGYEEALRPLGVYPTVAAIRRFVTSNANCLADGRFQIALGVDGHGLVGHVVAVEKEEYGVHAYQLLAACNKTLRVGARQGFEEGGEPAGTVDLRQPRNRFQAGDQMLWPGNVPLPSHYPQARFTGIKQWIDKGPAILYNALSQHVFHKAKPTDGDLLGFVQCMDLFKVYSVCNFEGRLSFRMDVECAYARPIGTLPSLATPWPSNISQGPSGMSALFGSYEMTTLQGHLTAAGRKQFNLAVYGVEAPTDVQLGAAVDTENVYWVYVKLAREDKFFIREDLVMISPPPYVGLVSSLPMIGQLDPLPAADPLPVPPVEPVPDKPPPYRFPLPEAPASPTPPMGGPISVPVNDVPAGIALPGPFGGGVGKRGWCYLALLDVECHQQAIQTLGFNPVFEDFVRFASRGDGRWSEDTFALTQVIQDNSDQGCSSIQAHVEPVAGGLSVFDVVQRLPLRARLGMATSELESLLTMQTEAQSADSPSVFDVKPKIAGTSMTFGVYAKLSPETSSFSWNLLGTPALALMFGIYESVRLESADFVATVSTGVDTSLWIAATENTVTLSGTDQWLAAPLNITICGASTGVVRGKFSLPRNHQFGKELRAATVGNHGPSFHFNHQGAAGSSSRVTGSVTVTVSGLAIIGHVNIGPVAKGKSVLQPVSDTVARFNASLGYAARPRPPTLDPEDCYMDGEGDGDEVPGGASSSGSPSANSGVKRP